MPQLPPWAQTVSYSGCLVRNFPSLSLYVPEHWMTQPRWQPWVGLPPRFFSVSARVSPLIFAASAKRPVAKL